MFCICAPVSVVGRGEASRALIFFFFLPLRRATGCLNNWAVNRSKLLELNSSSHPIPRPKRSRSPNCSRHDLNVNCSLIICVWHQLICMLIELCKSCTAILTADVSCIGHGISHAQGEVFFCVCQRANYLKWKSIDWLLFSTFSWQTGGQADNLVCQDTLAVSFIIESRLVNTFNYDCRRCGDFTCRTWICLMMMRLILLKALLRTCLAIELFESCCRALSVIRFSNLNSRK